MYIFIDFNIGITLSVYMEEFMDFTEYKCPVCNNQFTADDDIVVCPECGAPHHRQCYDELEHCYFDDKHSDGFVYEDLHKEETKTADDADDKGAQCPVCHTENPKGIFYCQKCGAPLSNNKPPQNNQNAQQTEDNAQQAQQNIPPNPMSFMFDPMAGLDSNQPIADDVTAGEMAKFVGKNTPYFLTVFNRIKSFNASKFNFSAFIFSGVYFLYRKMIGIGILLTAIECVLLVAQLFIMQTPDYIQLFSQFRELVNNQVPSAEILNQFSTSENLLLLFPSILQMINFAIMIVSGAVANRHYYKHCTKKIKETKAQESTEPISNRLEAVGGVNIALATAAAVVIFAINFFL